jgi:DNA polymerase-3 subunit alpha
VLSLESQAQKIEDWSKYLDECRKVQFPNSTKDTPHVGVHVKPPDVNLSDADFTVVHLPGEPKDNLNGHVRFGLKAIKGAGDAAIRAIVAERERGGAYHDIFEFCERVDLRSVNRATIEALVKAGAFDTLHGVPARASLAATIDDAVRTGQSRSEDRRVGQMTFFGNFAPEAAGTTEAPAVTAAPVATTGVLRNTPPWERLQALGYEKEALGFHVSGHPLDEYRNELATFCSTDSQGLAHMAADMPAVVGGILMRVRPVVSQRGRDPGRRMAMFSLADAAGTIDGVLFPDTFAKYGELLQQDRIVMLVGKVDASRAEPGLKVDQVIDIKDASQFLATRIEISVDGESNGRAEPALQMASGVLRQACSSVASLRGRPVDVHVNIRVEGRLVHFKSRGLRVVPDRDLLGKLSGVLQGVARVSVHGGFVPEREQPRWQKRFRPRDDE